MFFAEMKKIWKPGTIVLTVIISVLLFSTFMLRCVKPFLFSDGNESTEVTLELCSDLIDKYGHTIEAAEFVEIEKDYMCLLYGANAMIAETELFVQNDVHDYEEYFQYMQNAILGYEGYSYNTYAEMRDLIVQATGASAMYLETYEDIIQQYKSSSTTRTSILPFEILAYTNDYFTAMIIWCLICSFLIAAPVMVNDRANHVIANQYSSKKGKKVHKLQYQCMTLSVLITVSIISLITLLIWNKTGTSPYANSEIASFLNSVTAVFPLTYGGLILCFILIAYLLTLGIANIVFYLSAKSVNAVNMLFKTLPILIVGCFTGLSMEGLLCESNRLYKFLHIPGCELIVILIVLMIGVFLNIRNYRALQRSDY